MEPTLQDGEVTLVRLGGSNGTLFSRGIRPGDILWLQHPLRADKHIVKRLHSIGPDGHLHVRGDNPKESSDSRSFGSVPPSKVRGRVFARLQNEEAPDSGSRGLRK
jgi:phage repressor protein C with HTH and peptisase S24 domain